MEKNCPECGNEIFKPFDYCNACGWEKKEEPVIKKGPKKKPEEAIEKPKKPIKIKCKCGAVIKVKSPKRPLKIKCPRCGRLGTLKGTEKGAEKPTKKRTEKVGAAKSAPDKRKLDKPKPKKSKEISPSKRKTDRGSDIKRKKKGEFKSKKK